MTQRDTTQARPEDRSRAAERRTTTQLGERLRQLRVAAGLTQTDVAGDRFSKEYISQIERGKTRPTPDTIEWLAGRLGVDGGYLASGVSVDERAWHAGRSHWRGRDNVNDWSVGIELEGLEGERFEAAQYARLVELLQALRDERPIDEVVGHEHVAPGRKHDPGAGFEWAALRRALGWSARYFPASR